MALPLMLVGEKAEIHADSRFAYGTLGLKNEDDPKKSIPPTSKVRLFYYFNMEVWKQNCFYEK